MGYFKLALSTTIIKTSNEKIYFGRSETQKCMTSGLISKVNSSFSSYTLHCFFPFNFFFKYVCTYYTQMYMLLCSMPKLVKKYYAYTYCKAICYKISSVISDSLPHQQRARYKNQTHIICPDHTHCKIFKSSVFSLETHSEWP